MFADILDNQTLSAALAGIAVFAAVASLTLPRERDPRMTARLRMIAEERDQLRKARLAELAAPKAKVRHEAHSTLQAVGRTLKAHNRPGADDIAARLRMAGLRGPNPEAVFLFLSAALPLAFFAIAFVVLCLPGSTATLPFATFVAVTAGAVGLALPRLVLARLIARRQRAILRAFPDALDLLLICVQSGMSVEAALAKVTKDITCQSIELAEELSLTMAELAYLPSRWRAYQNLGERTGLAPVKLISAALAQAERYGTSISRALTAAARECREAQITEAERKAAALPPKLSVPLVTFFLPILLAVIVAPAVIKVSETLRQNGGHFTTPQAPRPGATTPHNQPAGLLAPTAHRPQ